MQPEEMTVWRQAAYRLFGALFLYPNRERLTKLASAAGELQKDSGTLAALPFFEPWQQLLAALSNLGEGDTTPVEEEFVRLFQARSAAPPYESFYLDPEGANRVWIATQLEQEYIEAGLSLSPSLMDMPDHIAVELEFMSFLCAGETQAEETETGASSAQARARQQVFIDRHLGRWFPKFAKRVQAAAPEGLYSLVVEAAYAFLRYDLSVLGLRRNGAGK